MGYSLFNDNVTCHCYCGYKLHSQQVNKIHTLSMYLLDTICNVIIEISNEAFKVSSGVAARGDSDILMLGLKEMHLIEVGHF